VIFVVPRNDKIGYIQPQRTEFCHTNYLII